jgi:hypothetical protein
MLITFLLFVSLFLIIDLGRQWNFEPDELAMAVVASILNRNETAVVGAVAHRVLILLSGQVCFIGFRLY